MTELLIIADDLTGAIETGVQLAKQSISTRVIPDPEIDFQKLISQSEATVLVFNTESRHIHPKEAAERVRNVVKMAKTSGIKQFYKKTDSTMRGNIGAELEAFIHGTGQRTLAFIPAHPKLKRFTRKGFHYIDKQLLHETEFGRDPLEPIEISYIPEILNKQTGIAINLIDLAKFGQLPVDEGILIFDCQSEHDLKKTGDFLLNNGLHNAIAGSAAMGEYLPQLFQLRAVKLKTPKLHGPILFINGSLNSVSLDQVKYASDKGVKTLSIPAELLSDSNFQKNQYFFSLLSQIKFEVNSGLDVILNSTSINTPADINSSNKECMKPDDFKLISEQIGLIVTSILKKVHLNTMTVFGGDTLMGIMQALNCEYVEPKLELVPGVALSLATIKNEVIQFVTKPGGYGDQDVIFQILDYMKKSNL